MKNKKKSKKKNNTVAIHVCKLTGDVANLDKQLKMDSESVLFAKALQNCNITDPVYFFRLKEPIQFIDIANRVMDSAESGRYNDHNTYVIIPGLTYSREIFKKYINFSSVEKFAFGDKVFYVFIKHDEVDTEEINIEEKDNTEEDKNITEKECE